MRDRPRVILALTPLTERQLEGLIFDTADPIFELLASSLQADELLGSVREQHPDAVLLSPELSGLTSAHCEHIRAVGARLLGIALDQREGTALQTLGVDTVLDARGLSRDQLAGAVGQPQAAGSQPASAPTPSARQRRDGERGRGTVLAVIGSRGAPGASELAASLSVLATPRWRTLLVELDALGGPLAMRAGTSPHDGSILGLVRATQAESQNGQLRQLVERWVREPAGWPVSVLPGVSDPDTLDDELLSAPGAVTRALHALSGLYPLTVCDVGFLLDHTLHPGARSHREAVIDADAILLVLGSSPTQLDRGLRQLQTIHETLEIPSERVRVIVNGLGAPASTGKSKIAPAIEGRLTDIGVSVDAWTPWDARGATRAAAQGIPLALAHPRGGYARTLARLLDELFLPSDGGAPKARRRRRRLAPPRLPRRTRHEQNEEEVILPWQT